MTPQFHSECPQGPCEETFCQCEMGQGYLQTCEEGTMFDVVQCVCNWPWNIPECDAQAASLVARPATRCTKQKPMF